MADKHDMLFLCIFAFICVCLVPRFAEGSKNCSANEDTVLQYTLNPSQMLPVTFGYDNLDNTTRFPNMTCGWNVTAPEGYVVLVHGVTLWRTRNESCEVEHTKVYDGPSSTSTKLGQSFCRDPLTSRYSLLLSNGRTVYVETNSGNSSSSGQISLIMFRFTAVKRADCSGGEVFNLTASTSVLNNFTSPYYQYTSRSDYINYPRNANCSWRIKAPRDSIVKVMVFIYIDCPNDTVKIYEGYHANEQYQLRKGCDGLSSQETYYSTDEYLLVQFQTDDVDQRAFGFRAHYSAMNKTNTCTGGKIFNVTSNTTDASIASPPYTYGKSATYPPNSNCAWQIQAPPGHVIKLKINSDLKCPSDSLRIYDGGREDKDLIIDLPQCSELYNKEVFSSDEHLFIRFESDASVQWDYSGFTVSYMAVPLATECSSSNTEDQNRNIRVTALQGVVLSPSYPSSTDVSCVWKFRGQAHHVMKFYLDWVDTQGPSSCTSYANRFIIQDVFNRDEVVDLNGMACRRTPSFYTLTSGKSANIEFRGYRSAMRSPGFIANFSSVPQDINTVGSCGANSSGIIHIRGQGATLFLPVNNQRRLPGTAVPSNMTCAWNITADPGYRIEVTSIPSININHCGKLNMEFHDGASTSSPVLIRLCQAASCPQQRPSCDITTPQPQYTSSNTLFVNIQTTPGDAVPWRASFMYRAVRKVPVPYACTWATGYLPRIITGGRGRIATPEYPRDYPNLDTCKWVIKAPFAKLVGLRFSTFNLQESLNCTKDSTYVRDGPYGYSSPVLARLCGKLPKPREFVSTGDYMSVLFTSDKEGRYPGFDAEFYPVDDPSFGNCTIQGQDNQIFLSGSSGSFFSPKYPKSFPKNMSCSWVITAPQNKKIKLKLKPSLSSNCNAYLEVRDGGAANSTLLGKFCGYNTPSNVYSSGERMWVRFVSGQSSGGLYFTATYEAVNAQPLKIACRHSNDFKEIKLSGNPTGSLASFDYPVKYENDITCIWKITVSNWRRIKLTFDSFNLEKSSGCLSDYVVVRDGYSFKEVLGRFCGTSIPEPVYSTDEFLWIKFKTNGSGRYGGFKASFESELSILALVLIIVGTIVGVVVIVAYCVYVFRDEIRTFCRRRSTQAVPDGISAAGSNIALTNMKT